MVLVCYTHCYIDCGMFISISFYHLIFPVHIEILFIFLRTFCNFLYIVQIDVGTNFLNICIYAQDISKAINKLQA